MPAFKLPEVEENAEGWGPISVPEQFRDIPFMPYSKGDRLGRIADFGQMAQQRQFQGRYRDQMSGPAVFNFEKAEEEETFQLIDNKPVKKAAGQQQRRGGGGRGWGQQGGRGWGQQEQRGGQQEQRGGHVQRGRGGAQQQQRRQQWGGFRPWDQPRTQYTSSVDIRPEWHVVGDQINFSALQKLTTQVGEATDLVSCGELAFYDKAADRVTPKMPAKLRRTAARTRSSSTSEDPIIRRLAAEGTGQVFMTDALLTTLMCAPRSVYPWDIVITRKEGQLFLDKRPNSSLDFLTNGETAPDPLPEEKDNVNGVQALGVEATAVNQAFREQVLSAGSERYSLGQALEIGGNTLAGYKYRKWSLGGTDLVVRCEMDGAIKLGDGVQIVAVHALNEFDPKWSGVDWRQKLENQRGAVLATELKNNANKIAKWTAAALLSGVDLIKLGYITRAAPKDNRNHLVLGTQAVKPKDFAAQMNLNMDNCWGIVRALVDLCLEKLDVDGKYLMVKDPNKPQLRIYAVPANEAIETQYTEAADGEGEEEGQAAGAKEED